VSAAASVEVIAIATVNRK